MVFLRKWITLVICVLILGTLLVGCSNSKQPGSINSTAGSGSEKTLQVDLYFSDRDGYLRVEKRELPDNDRVLLAVVEELVKGPAEGSELTHTIPEGTIVHSVKLDGNTAIVDFSEEIQLNHWGGSLGESITLFSIVNTLSQFKQVEQVEITIEGKKVVTLAGHLDLTQPLTPNQNLVRN
ncbi:MAG: GerMN domain-containing protein [Clostridia bacterium]|jgi:spore germination protein GerM|nr:GerMN domain-containing protein [Clostridia bacterium]MDQ7791527.1 GerMN domain-containing protein [Clostridia bacterium]